MINRRLFMGLILMLFLMSGCGRGVATDPLSSGVPVSVQTVTTMDFSETAYFVGELASSLEYDIPTGQSGRIQKVLVKTGDSVSKGQPLFILEHDQLRVELESQETQLRNQVAFSDLQLLEAQKQLDIAAALYQQGAVSKDSYDQSRLRLEQAQFNAENARASLRLTTTRLRNQISDAMVISPVQGMVAFNGITAGQEVGNITAMKIIGLSGLVVNGSVPESVISKVKLGQRASVHFSEGSAGAEGRVVRIDSVPGNQQHLYGVQIQLDADDPFLRSGMYAEVSLNTALHAQRVGIPKKALRKDEEGTFVVIASQGKAAFRRVTTGLVNGEWIEIHEGLAAEDSLIVKGQTYLKEGDPVVIVQQ